MLVPMVLFLVLIVLGRSVLEWKGILLCVFLWAASCVTFYSLGLHSYYFVGFQALFDIILILIIFGGDLTIR